MAIHRFERNALPATPWKNGGGSTREILSWPPGAGLDAFDWRLSIATIGASGPFSVFPGIDRSIMLLEGDGVQLHSEGFEHRLDQPHEPFAFSGDAVVDCRLLGAKDFSSPAPRFERDATPRGGGEPASGRPSGGSTDFNVMTRRGRWRADVQVLHAASAIAAAPHGLLLALRGAWRLGSGAGLREGEGLCWADAMQAWEAVPEGAGARLAAVRIVAA